MTWSVEGTYIEACNCEVACPCIFFSPPTEGECKVIVGWHIDKGRHGDAVLDGLNAALIAYAPGNMKDGKWKVALYLDERGNDKQRAALQGIFSGADGGHLANLGPLIAQVLGARSARITFDKGANSRFRLEVEGAASTEMQPVEGQGGGSHGGRRLRRRGLHHQRAPGDPEFVEQQVPEKCGRHEARGAQHRKWATAGLEVSQ